MRRIKRIRSYSEHARFLATVNDNNFELSIARDPSIRTPYSYSPSWTVYTDSQGRNVVLLETAHRQYDVFQLE
jgi:hypothetical protein